MTEDQRPTLAEPHPERFSVEAAENGEYPALCDEQNCKPCEESEAAWAAEREAVAADEAQESALMESRWAEMEAGS
jgi:hypothetical protein